MWGWPILHPEHHIQVEELDAMRHRADTLGDAMYAALLETGMSVEQALEAPP